MFNLLAGEASQAEEYVSWELTGKEMLDITI
jgi:hypothetical protein